MKKIHEIIVIGGGISGVSFASLASKLGKNVLLLEKKNKLGGAINSIRFQDDFFIELGAHTCYNTYLNFIDLIKNSDLTNHIKGRIKIHYKYLKNSRLENIRQQIRWIELFTHLPNLLICRKSNKTVKEFYTKILGYNNYINFAKSFFSAVICQNPDNYPAELFLKIRSKKDRTLPRSFTFSKGLSQVVNSLKPTFNFMCNKDVSNLTFENEKYTIKLKSGEILQSKKIVIATNSYVASNLVRNLNRKLSKLLLNIKPVKIYSLGFICGKDDIKLPLIAGIIPNDKTFLSMVSRDLIPHNYLRGFSFHFDMQMINRFDPEQIALRVLGIKKEKMIHKTAEYSTLPTLEKHHPKLVNSIDNFFHEIPNLYLLGNYFEGISIEDCLSRVNKEFQRMIKI